jgi:hypothetical protein
MLTFNILTLKDFGCSRQVGPVAHGGPFAYGCGVPDHQPFDPIAEAHRQWAARWPEQADNMAAVTSVMRVQQLLLARVEDTLKPYGLTFAAY